jgi:hypothetical protein
LKISTKTILFAALAVGAYIGLPLLWTTNGTVIDAKSGRPVSGAFVVASWRASLVAPVHGGSRCYNIEVRRTDQNGHYRIAWLTRNLNPMLIDRRRNVGVYAPGYKTQRYLSESSNDFSLAPLEGSNTDRFKAMSLPPDGGCSLDDDLGELYRVFYGELMAAAESNAEKVQALGVLNMAETIELGEQAASTAFMKRAAPFMIEEKR